MVKPLAISIRYEVRRAMKKHTVIIVKLTLQTKRRRSCQTQMLVCCKFLSRNIVNKRSKPKEN
jgi:hypothetical protein